MILPSDPGVPPGDVARKFRYFPKSPTWVGEHEKSLDQLEKLGWSFFHTGGGCTAMYFRKGKYEILTTDGNLDVPSPDAEDNDIGVYLDEPDSGMCGGEAPLSLVDHLRWVELTSRTAEEWLDYLVGLIGK